MTVSVWKATFTSDLHMRELREKEEKGPSERGEEPPKVGEVSPKAERAALALKRPIMDSPLEKRET